MSNDLNDGIDSYSSPYKAYWEASKAPLTCFIFTLPLFIIYHGGLWLLNNFTSLRWANAADMIIAQALDKLGIAGPFLSFFFVILVFLFLQAVSGKPWKLPKFSTWMFMLLESIIFAVPVFLLFRLILHVITEMPLSMLDATEATEHAISWQVNLILSCGAGVYEEFFFRLVLLNILIFILTKVFARKSIILFICAAILQALVFAAFHHLPGSPEAVTNWVEAKAILPVFSFRMLAGLYFAILYIERGFGITAGAHAAYDLYAVLLEYMNS